MEMLGLIAAMAQESDALLRNIQGWKRIAVGSFRGICFELSGQTCLLVTSGMGARRAGEAARALVEMNAPRYLISFGIAGAVEPDLEIGDVVAAETFCRLDQGVPGPFLPLDPWPDAAREAAVQVLAGRGARLFHGTSVTTGGPQAMEYRRGEMLHPILEMETAGIAQVAAEKGIPFLSLRAISDGPRAPIPFNLGEVLDENANLHVAGFLKAIARRPGIVLQFGRLRRNSRIAAENAAVALVAAVSQLIVEPHNS
jgi:adenosylhomocysteine nucleosidase